MAAKPRRLTSNLINLSDAFRRGAEFTKPEAAKTLAKLSRRLSVHLTYYRGEFAESHLNEDLIGKVRDTISDITKVAKAAGLTKVTLPFADNEANPMAMWLKSDVLADQDFAVDVEFAKGDYKTDLSYLGNINRQKNKITCLEEGIRGISDIDPELKNKWDMKPR